MKGSLVRYRLFEIWRFIAALLIMFYHFAHFAPEQSQWVKTSLESLRLLLDLFFIISGYLIFTRYADQVQGVSSYLRYLGRRLVRLYPLHVITLGYFVAVGVAVSLGLTRTGGGRDLYQWDMLIPNLLLIQAWGVSDALTFNFVSWSVSAEWFAYLALPILILVHRSAGLVGLFALSVFSYAALQVMIRFGLMPFPSWVQADTWGAYRVFADFALGAFLSVLVTRCPLRFGSRLPAWAALIGACALMTLDVNLYLSLVVLALAVFLAGLVETNEPERFSYPVFLQPAAVVSFGIYLWHPVIENLMLSFVWNKFIASPSSTVFFGYVAIAMLLTVVVAIISFRCFETPMAHLLSRLMGLKKTAVSVAPAAV